MVVADPGVQAATYRGPDRRRAPVVPPSSPFDRQFLAAAVACGGLGVAVLAVTLAGAEPEVGALFAVAVTATVAMVVMAGGLCVAHWRMNGFAPALWAGAALVLLGASALALTEPLADAVAAPDALMPLAVAAVIVAGALVAFGVARSPVDARLTPARVLWWATASTALVAVALAGPGVDALALAVPRSPGEVPELGAAPLLAAGWLGVAVSCLRRRSDHGSVLFAWLGLMALAITLAQVVVLVAVVAEQPLPAGRQALLLTGAAFALYGAGWELRASFARQREALLSSQVAAETAAAQVRRARATAEELAHDAGNALFAIAGATRTLERYRDALPSATRDSLSEAVAAEVAKLQRLIEGLPVELDPGRSATGAGSARLDGGTGLVAPAVDGGEDPLEPRDVDDDVGGGPLRKARFGRRPRLRRLVVRTGRRGGREADDQVSDEPGR